MLRGETTNQIKSVEVMVYISEQTSGKEAPRLISEYLLKCLQ